MAQYG
ncbi:Protein of unknown function [Propionibacterium freudenreichii subsp. freudenreichii]